MTDQMIAWEIEEWIRDYKFMLREIKRLNRVLNKVDFISTKLTATYGRKRHAKGISRRQSGRIAADGPKRKAASQI